MDGVPHTINELYIHPAHVRLGVLPGRLGIGGGEGGRRRTSLWISAWSSSSEDSEAVPGALKRVKGFLLLPPPSSRCSCCFFTMRLPPPPAAAPWRGSRGSQSPMLVVAALLYVGVAPVRGPVIRGAFN